MHGSRLDAILWHPGFGPRSVVWRPLAYRTHGDLVLPPKEISALSGCSEVSWRSLTVIIAGCPNTLTIKTSKPHCRRAFVTTQECRTHKELQQLKSASYPYVPSVRQLSPGKKHKDETMGKIWGWGVCIAHHTLPSASHLWACYLTSWAAIKPCS